MSATRQYAPEILVTKQFVGDPPHVRNIFRIGANSAQDTENRLYKKWRLDQTTIEEMSQVVQMPNVVTFELEPGATTFTQYL